MQQEKEHQYGYPKISLHAPESALALGAGSDRTCEILWETVRIEVMREHQ
jgi:hypothetical protein